MKHNILIVIFFLVSLVSLSILPAINYVKNPQDFSTKHLFNTDRIESYRNHIFWRFFNKSMEQEKVITGKDDF